MLAVWRAGLDSRVSGLEGVTSAIVATSVGNFGGWGHPTENIASIRQESVRIEA